MNVSCLMIAPGPSRTRERSCSITNPVDREGHDIGPVDEQPSPLAEHLDEGDKILNIPLAPAIAQKPERSPGHE